MRQVTPQPIVSDIRTTQILKELCEAVNQGAAGLLWPHVAKSGTAYASGPGECVIYVTPTGPFTLTLPDPKETMGKVIAVIRSDGSSHTITVDPAVGLIGGAATATITGSYQGAIYHSDGVGYYPLGQVVAGGGTGTVTSVAATAPAAGFTVSGSPITTSGTLTFALANDLAAVEALAATGIVRRTGAETWSAGTTVSTAEIADDAVTNAKSANMATKTYKGRTSSGTGDPEDVAVATVRVDLGEKVTALTDGATISVDATLSNNFRVTLGGNRTLANPTGLIDGQVINFRIKQDATGGRTLAYGTMYKFPGGSAPVLSTAANALDFMSAQYDATDSTLVCVMNKAFA